MCKKKKNWIDIFINHRDTRYTGTYPLACRYYFNSPFNPLKKSYCFTYDFKCLSRNKSI